MDREVLKKQLVLIPGGKEEDFVEDGPVTRLDLWDRFPTYSKSHIAILVLSKIAVISGLIYFIYW